MENLTNKKRIVEIDFLRGIAIILVVVGHAVNLINVNNNLYLKYVFDYIYIYHMPLFFLISGYLYKLNFNKRKKAFHLLVPFFVCSSPLIFRHIITGFWSSNFYYNFILEIKNLLTGGYYWYLIFLFYYEFLSIIYVKRETVEYGVQKVLLILVLCILLEFCYMKNYYEVLSKFLFNYLFFVVGYLLKIKYRENLFTHKDNKKYIFVSGILSIVVCVLFLIQRNIILKFIAASASIWFFILLSKSIRIKDNNPIIKIGKNTMIIYLFDLYLIIFERKISQYGFFSLAFIMIVNLIIPILTNHFIISKSKFLKTISGTS